MTWYTENKTFVDSALALMVLSFIHNLAVANQEKPANGKSFYARLWSILGYAAFLTFKNAAGTLKLPFTPQGPPVMTAQEAMEKFVARAMDPDPVPIPDQAQNPVKLPILGLILIAGLSACGTTYHTIGIAANGLAVAVHRIDTLYAQGYKTYSNAYISNHEFIDLVKNKGSIAAMDGYRKYMQTWDQGAVQVETARSATLAIATTIRSVGSRSSATPLLIENLGYTTGIVIMAAQSALDLGLVLPSEITGTMTRVCLTLAVLSPGKDPGGCQDLIKSGTLIKVKSLP